MTREEAVKELYEWLDGCCGGEEIEQTREALSMAIEALRAQEVKNSNQELKNSNQELKNQSALITIDKQAAIDALRDEFKRTPTTAIRAMDVIGRLPSAQPDERWNRLMMYFADLQLTYSPGWGANGCGDQKLYDFVTELIERLEGWENDE